MLFLLFGNLIRKKTFKVLFIYHFFCLKYDTECIYLLNACLFGLMFFHVYSLKCFWVIVFVISSLHAVKKIPWAKNYVHTNSYFYINDQASIYGNKYNCTVHKWLHVRYLCVTSPMLFLFWSKHQSPYRENSIKIVSHW